MHESGIHFGKDLMQLDRFELIKRYGKVGKHYHNILTSQDSREVKPNRIRKSIGAENTFSEDLLTEAAFIDELRMIHETVMKRLNKNGRKARTVTLKIKYFDFVQKTRSRTFEGYTSNSDFIWDSVVKLLNEPQLPEKGVRLFGITLSNLNLKEQE